MSKVFSTFLLIILAVIALTIFANLKSVFASHTIDDSSIKIERLPSGEIDESFREITFTITATREIFQTGQNYSWAVDKSTWGGQGYCTNGLGEIKPNDAKTIKITMPNNGACIREIGNWRLRVWFSDLNKREDGNLIIKNYPYSISQAGGGIPGLEPFKTPLTLGETPQVTLINARKGNTYKLWWDGAQTNWAAPFQRPTSDGNINNITLSKSGGNITSSGPKKLCMDLLASTFTTLPFASTCTYPTIFIFETIPGSTPVTTDPKCSIIPPNPIKNSSVSIKGENLPLNQEFRAELFTNTDPVIALTERQNSFNSGNISLNLGAHLQEGGYAANIYGPNGFICSTSFSVSEYFVPTPPVLPGTLSSGGGEPCDTKDNRGPAMKTAIGCIHTNPAEFIKDFLTFIIAISGGLAFLMMLLGAFGMLTSAGNPDTLNAGRERLTSAIIGLLFVIFAILLMQIIGFDILKLPGFGR